MRERERERERGREGGREREREGGREGGREREGEKRSDSVWQQRLATGSTCGQEKMKILNEPF